MIKSNYSKHKYHRILDIKENTVGELLFNLSCYYKFGCNFALLSVRNAKKFQRQHLKNQSQYCSSLLFLDMHIHELKKKSCC